MLNPSNLAFMMKRISFALALVALIASSSLADTTVRNLRIWPSDTSPGLLGLVKGQLKIDNLITDDSGFSLEVGVGTSSKVFDFPAENCRNRRNGGYTCLVDETGQRKAQRQLRIRKRGGSGTSRVNFYLANTELPGPITGAVSIVLTSGGGTYMVDSGECTRRPRHTTRTRYRCAEGTGVAERCANPDASDTTAPSSVSGMQLSTVGNDLQVDWTNPGDSDFGGVVLLRQARQPIFVNGATDGAALAAGDTVDGVEVVYVGVDATFADTTATPGINYAYTAIAHDCTLNYADVADQVMGVHALPTQRATLSISDPAGSPVVTLTSAPADMNLAISAATAAGGELSFTVSATNNLSATLIHPKVEILSVSEGAASGTAGTTLAGDPFYRFMTSLPLFSDSAAFQARLALASGATADQGIVFTGVAGAVDPLVVEVEIGFDPAVGYHSDEDYYAADNIIAMFQDTGTNTIAPIEAKASGVAAGGDPHGSCGAVQFTADNRWMLCASSHAAALKIYDMAEFGVQANPSMLEFFINHDPALNSLAAINYDIEEYASPFRGLRLSPDGSRLYATIGSTNTGGDLNTYWDGMDVVEIDISDPENPAELRRLSLETDGSDEFTSEHMAISPDGTTLAFLTTGRSPEVIFVVDTGTMTQIGDVVEIGDYRESAEGKSLTWRGNLGFVLAGWDVPVGSSWVDRTPALLYVDALDDFATDLIAVTGRATYPSSGGTNSGDWFNVLDLQGRFWDNSWHNSNLSMYAEKIIHITDWQPGQATATATPLHGLMIRTNSDDGTLTLSPDGQYIYTNDRGVGGGDTSATISVDTLAAEPAPAPERSSTGFYIGEGDDENDWSAMTLR
jgi:hypothetical protein